MMRIKLSEYFIGVIAIISIAVFFLINSIYSEGSIYGGDSYAHYLIARFAFAHPANFLNHWGKPFFTLLASPFAYFGFHGMMVFNILVCMLSSFLTFLVVRKLGYKNGLLTIIFTSFTPIFILLMFSGLTEAFFALMLIATVYFFITDRFLLTAIIISFVPFVRSEGLMFVFWFMLLLMFKRQYKTLPFVFLGTFFYSILGGVITGDFLWLINDNPYSASSQIYGHGSLFDYVTSVPSTFGFIVFCLAILGFLTVFAFYFISKFRKEKISNTWFNEFFVIGCSAIGYFLFHSIIWWKGWMSVLGDPRFMAAIVPLMAILALKGFNVCLYPVKKQWLIWTVMLIVSVAMIYFSLKRYLLPVKFQGPDYYVNCALDWMKQNQYDKNKIIYYNVLVPVLIDADPFENERLQSSVPDNMNPEIGVEKNTIVIWDGHFSSLEGQLPLQKMLENSNYKLLKLIEPNPPFKLVRDEDYKVAVFIRK